MTRRYPLAPLFGLTGWTMTDVRDLAPCGGEEYRLRLEHGVTERIADRLAVAAGLHPHVVWPEMADHAIEDHQRACANTRCSRRFVPSRADQRFCCPACRVRQWERDRYRADANYRAAQNARSRAYQRVRRRARRVKRAASREPRDGPR